jgi:hypothetical protein
MKSIYPCVSLRDSCSNTFWKKAANQLSNNHPSLEECFFMNIIGQAARLELTSLNSNRFHK